MIKTAFNEVGDYKTFYYARFTTAQFDPALSWKSNTGTTFTAGPSFQYYSFDNKDNTGRLITNPLLTNTDDSYTFDKRKVFAGIVLNLTSDKRNNKIIPSWGSYVNIKLQGYTGLNTYSTTFTQLIPQAALYKSLNTKGTIVLAERVGGGITIGKTPFYQSLFLDGQNNLSSYRLYRFASYIVPGQIGILGFYDVGRVWGKGEHSDKWYNGTGGGFM